MITNEMVLNTLFVDQTGFQKCYTCSVVGTLDTYLGVSYNVRRAVFQA